MVGEYPCSKCGHSHELSKAEANGEAYKPIRTECRGYDDAHEEAVFRYRHNIY